MCELGLTHSELSYMKKHVKGFARERSVRTPGRYTGLPAVQKFAEHDAFCRQLDFGGAHVTWDDEIMQEEIFGPLLPILTYDSIADVVQTINNRPHPLALYLFTEEQNTVQYVTARCQ